MRPPAIDDATVNIEQAAEAAGVSRRAIYYWMRHGKLSYTTVRGSRRVILAEVLAAKQGSWAGRERERDEGRR
jgi:excisionase family DNA binding protein